MTTYITDYNGSCLTNGGDCVTLSISIPAFGCGAIYARIWCAGVILNIQECDCSNPLIKLISDL